MAQKNIDPKVAVSLLSIFLLLFIVVVLWMGSSFTPINPPINQSDQSEGQLAGFKSAIELSDPQGQLFDNSKTSRRENIATVTVTEKFKSLSYKTRLDTAKNLHKIWANLISPSDPAKAFLKLEDTNGSLVGGSSGSGDAIFVDN